MSILSQLKAAKLVEALLENTVVVCAECDKEFGPQQFPSDTKLSHGMCRRHGVQYLMSIGMTREQAEAKLSPGAGAPDRSPDARKQF